MLFMEKSRIHALAEDVINKIAAGEVVERPASAVKELVENALDAGASKIDVQIVNGGKTSILIRDNGCGMSAEDLNLCYLPHTTSKLTSADELFHLATNGFRGEAVASIAAISKLSITSREEDAAEAKRVILCGGNLERTETDASPRGTTFLVEDFFFNTPVRKTYLGSDTLEASRILDAISRLALANPKVRFTYKVNGRDVLSCAPDSDLRSRIAEVLGAGTARSMIPVDYEEAGIRVSGFAVPPASLQGKRSKLYFYVQKRPIWNPVMSKAVARAYEPYGNSFAPTAVLFLEMDELAVDVNVHPNKREVRFANESDVFLAVHHALREAFQQGSDEHPTIRIEDLAEVGAKPAPAENLPAPTFSIPKFSPKSETVLAQAPNEIPKNSVGERKPKYRANDADDIVQDLFSLPENGNIIPLTPQNLRPPTRIDKTPPPQFLSLAKTYMVCEDNEGLLLVDQNAAHQRILYEQALEALAAETTMDSQELLFPEIVEFSAAESSIIPEIRETLDRLGFHLELFGKNAYQLRGTPRDLPFSRSVEALRELISAVVEGEDPKNPAREALARAWAKGNAIQAGDKLSSEEMAQLMAALIATQDPMTSPSGRPTLLRLPIAEIHKRFHR